MKTGCYPAIAAVCLLTIVASCGQGSIDVGEMGTATSSLESAGKPQMNSLESTSSGMTLHFAITDSLTTSVSVYRMDREEGFYRRANGSLTSSGQNYTFSDSGVILAHEYCYTVGARRDGQSRATMSDPLCAVHDGGDTLQVPAAPSHLQLIYAGQEWLKLSFRDESNVEDYLTLERRPWLVGSSAPWQEIYRRSAISGSGGLVVVTDDGLEMEQKYCYRARAINEDGSRVSSTICEKTAPLEVTDPEWNIPVVTPPPLSVTLTHPYNDMLQLRWIDSVDGQSDWLVRLYIAPNTVVGRDEIRVIPVHDHTANPGSTHFINITDLDPDKRYCVQVVRKASDVSNTLCESPFGERTSLSHVGPASVPVIDRLELPDRHQVRLRLLDNVEGQMIEMIDESSGIRQNVMDGYAGSNNITIDNLADNVEICLRLWVSNRYGTRYGPLHCFTTLPDNSQEDDWVDCLGDPIECGYNMNDRYKQVCSAREPGAADPYWNGCPRASEYLRQKMSFATARGCIPAADFEEWGCLVLDADAILCDDGEPFNLTVYLTTSDVSLDCNNQTIDHGWPSGGKHSAFETPMEYSVSNIQIRNCDIRNVGGYGFKLKRHFRGAELDGPMQGHRNIQVSDCSVAHTGQIGVYVGQNSQAFSFDNVEVSDTHTGFYLEAGSNETLITHSVINYSRKGGGIHIDSSHHNTIEHSVFYNNNGAGIRLYKNCGEVYGQICPIRRPHGASHNTIYHNQFYSEGVRVASRQFKFYAGGWCAGIDLAGYWRDRAGDNEVVDNLFAYGAKLDIQDSPTSADDNLFINSLLEIGSGDPIGDDPIHYAGTIVNNLFTQDSWLGVQGSPSRAFEDVEVHNNRVDDMSCMTEFEPRAVCGTPEVVHTHDGICYSYPLNIPGASCDP